MSNRHEDTERGRDAGWLTGLLDAEAERYAPDGRRIRAALHQRIRGGRQRELARVRPSRKTAGVAMVTLAVAAVAVIAIIETRPAPVVSSPTAASSTLPPVSRNPSARSSITGNGSATQNAVGHSPVPTSAPTTAAPTLSPSPTPHVSATSTSSAVAGANLVSATGSNDLGAFPYWLQEEVSVSLREPVAALQLTVTVARSAEVASTGYWTTDDPSVFDVTVDAQANTLTYTFTLKSGHTLPAGNSAFAVQFNHGTNAHNPAADTYALTVTGDEQQGPAEATTTGQL